MAGSFDDVTLTWGGVDYTIPSNKMMGAIARIEDHVTMPELQQFGQRGTIPLSRLAAAFAAVLRYAGCKVSDEDVYEAMFDGDQAQSMVQSTTTLMGMMVPRKARDRYLTAVREANGAEANPGNSVPTATASSVKRSNSRSGKSGSPRRSSGTSRQKNSTG